MKTHDHWTYTRLTIGEYLWTSPHGYRFHVTTQGTTDITHPRKHPNRADPPERPTPRP